MKLKLLFGAFNAMALMSAVSVAAQNFQPVTIQSGYSADVIANGVGPSINSTTSDVDGVSFAFVSRDFQSTASSTPLTYGLPTDGMVTSVVATTPGLTYKLGDYNLNNSLKLSATNDSGTLVFSNPVPAFRLYMLATSGSGASTATVVVNFTDNTSQTITGVAVADWYGATGFAIQGFGRINRTNDNLESGNNTNPRLYQILLNIDAANQSKPIQSVTVTNYYHSLDFTDLTPDHFIVTNGGSEALNFAISTLCDDGDEVIIPEPYYANYNGFTSTFNVNVVAVPSTIDTGFALPPIEDFEKKITEKTRAIILCNPGNPTGYLYTREELQKLAEIALKYDIVVISDEVYREYVYDGKQQISMLAFPELSENCIIIDSESKRYSMCGVRIGCLITRSKKIRDAAMLFAQARLSPVLLGQIAATAAHQNDGPYIRAVREEYTHRRNILVDLLNEIPGVICPKPKGAFYCVAELPVDDTEKFAQWLLEKYSNNGETIMVAPAGGFYSDPELGKKQVRIAYVLNEQDLKRSAAILRDALEVYRLEFSL